MARKECAINGLRWVHIEHPSQDDFKFLDEVFQFHPLVKESIVTPTLHPSIENFDDHLFLILHFPVIYDTHQANKIAEVDFLITRDLLVTITYMDFKNLEVLFAEFKNNVDIQKRILTQKHTGLLLHHVIDSLFQKLLKSLEQIEKEITRIENSIFKERNYKLVEEISHARRDILDLRRSLRPQSAVLKSLTEKGEWFYGERMAPYFVDTLSTEGRIENLVENQRETIEVLHHTNESLMSSNRSNIMAILTIFSAVVLPLNLIASLWGMNHRWMPLRDGPFDFWIVLAAMFALLVGLIIFFKQKRWL